MESNTPHGENRNSQSEQSEAQRNVRRRGSRSRAILIVLFILALFGILLVIGWIPRMRQQARASSAAKAAQPSFVSVNTVVAAKSPPGSNLQLPADIQAIQVTTISARTSGYLKKLYADIGDRVKAGQLLAEIDTPEAEQETAQAEAALQQSKAALAQAEANLSQAKTNTELARVSYQRYQDLLSQGVISQQDVDTRKAAYEAGLSTVNAQVANVNASRQVITANEANLRRLTQLHSYNRVYAPYAGVITARNVDVGSLISGGGTSTSTASSSGVNASSSTSNGSAVSTTTASSSSTGGTGGGGVLFSVARIDTLRIFVSVPQSYVGSIRPGQTMDIIVRELSQDLKAKVVRTSSALDSSSRTLLTELQLDNRNHALLPGMYAEVKLNVTLDESALRVPANALVIRSDGTQVAIVTSENKVHFQNVTIGKDYGPMVDIVGGLQPGAVLIVNPGDRIKEGIAVQINNAGQTEPPKPQGQQR